MQGLRDFGSALTVALLSVGLMFGVLSISLVEFQPEAAPAPTDPIQPSPAPITPTSTLPPTNTLLPGADVPTTSPTFTSIAQSSCPLPTGWTSIIVPPGATIFSIADQYRVTREQLISTNCMLTDSLVSGTTLYVPSQVTSTVAACIPGAVNWIPYTVKPGDTLFSIAVNRYTNYLLIQSVNCINTSAIKSGQVLWVPSVSTRTPYPSPLPGSSATQPPTEQLTETAVPFTATSIPTNTSTPTPTKTVTPTRETTLTPSPTAIP